MEPPDELRQDPGEGFVRAIVTICAIGAVALAVLLAYAAWTGLAG